MQIMKLAARKVASSEDTLIKCVASGQAGARPPAFAVSGPCAVFLDRAPSEGEAAEMASSAFMGAINAPLVDSLDSSGACVVSGGNVFCLGARRVTDDSRAKEFERLRKNLATAGKSVTAVVLPTYENIAPVDATSQDEAPQELADEKPAKPAKPAKKKAAKKPAKVEPPMEEREVFVSAPIEKRVYRALETLEHPTWGHGVVTETRGDIYIVEFPEVGVKRISAEWVDKNIR